MIGPLFLDDLHAEFNRVKTSRDKLFEFWKKLANLHFLDPACGCGNFLVISYRELRRLELDVLRAAETFGQRIGTVFQALKIDVDQFYGIEIAEFPAQVAQVAMWLMDHQMNLEAGEVFGEPVTRIPLVKSAHIRHANALEIDWAEFVPPQRLNYILGNPPFVGKQYQTEAQKADIARIAAGIKGAGVLDYVAAWYFKAARYLTDEPETFGAIVNKANPGRKKFKDIRFGKGENAVSDMFIDSVEIEARARRAVKCAFVSTNSITQGEQVGILWSWLLAQGIHIHFAHRTFKWTNEAPGKAAVHCVIIGFAAFEADRKRLFEYEAIDGEPHEIRAGTINPYLVDAPELLLTKRRMPISPSAPAMAFGSMPNDGGHLILLVHEKDALVAIDSAMARFLRPLFGSEEFIAGVSRWCLWLRDAKPSDVRASHALRERLALVKQKRLKSKRATTQKLAATPALFGEIRQPKQRYLAVPEVSSEGRAFIPIGFLDADVIATNKLYTVDGATLLHFGVLTSSMHMAWTRSVCGRLESRYQYSAGIVYNNFPWPSLIDEQRYADAKSIRLRAAIEATAQGVLDARAKFHGESLAALYNPETMPPLLVRAHEKLDRAVDAAYAPDGGKRNWASDSERVAFLFKLYQAITSFLPTATDQGVRLRRAATDARSRTIRG